VWLLRLCISLSCALALALAVSWFAIDWTDEGSDDYAGGVVLRDAAGDVLRVSLGEGDVDCRPYYRASRDDWIVKALVAAEDGTFWTHRGVRPLSAARAAVQNVFNRRRVSGASTITMQAVRLAKPHPKSLWWKWKEAVMALKMERALSKEQILSQYLNRAPFGSNLVGIEAAAQGWFGKGAKEL
jgi:penicillin-binding protein 1C